MIHRDIVEGSPEWHAIRLNNIGGSEIASLIGVQPQTRMSKFTLHMVKARKIPPPKLDDGPGSRIWYGKQMEATIANMAAELNGWKIEKGHYHTDDYCPGMACSVDYTILEPGIFETKMHFHGPGVMQVKNSDYIQHKEEWTGDQPPPYVIAQLQHEIACTNLTWGVIVVLTGGNLIDTYHYAASHRMIDGIREKVREFWADVKAGRVPNVDGTDSTAAALKALFPSQHNPVPISFVGDKEFMLGCVARINSLANKAASETADKAAKAYLESRLQGATSAVTDGYRISVSVNSANGGRTIRIREDHRR